MKELGEYLKRLRGDLSLREAAKRSGLSYTYIGSLESGKHPRTGDPITPSPDTLFKLAKAYNHDYEDLLKVAGIMPDKIDPSTELIEYLEMELTDEQIMERMTFKVDGMVLSEEEVKEFITFVRVNRAMKKQRPVVLRVEEP